MSSPVLEASVIACEKALNELACEEALNEIACEEASVLA